jgi:predicted nucleotidyltransferase
MNGNDVFQRVRDALARLELERNVRVLYACESGSRAWGFASRDSDYDVRFLYVHARTGISRSKTAATSSSNRSTPIST